MMGAQGLLGKSWPDLDMLPLGWLTNEGIIHCSPSFWVILSARGATDPITLRELSSKKGHISYIITNSGLA